MIPSKVYYILAFDTTTDVMSAEAALKDHFPIAIMPVPQEISKGCGLAIRFLNPDETSIIDFLDASSMGGSLYKMNTQKINGIHPVEKIH